MMSVVGVRQGKWHLLEQRLGQTYLKGPVGGGSSSTEIVQSWRAQLSFALETSARQPTSSWPKTTLMHVHVRKQSHVHVHMASSAPQIVQQATITAMQMGLPVFAHVGAHIL